MNNRESDLLSISMKKFKKAPFTRESLWRLLPAAFGLTLFPGMVYALGKSLIALPYASIFDFYSYFYWSLLDMGEDGLIAWGIACGPSMLYEGYLLARGIRR